jgi:hypothetical protein
MVWYHNNRHNYTETLTTPIIMSYDTYLGVDGVHGQHEEHVTCITLLDTIILNIYTKDAY